MRGLVLEKIVPNDRQRDKFHGMLVNGTVDFSYYDVDGRKITTTGTLLGKYLPYGGKYVHDDEWDKESGKFVYWDLQS